MTPQLQRLTDIKEKAVALTARADAVAMEARQIAGGIENLVQELFEVLDAAATPREPYVAIEDLADFRRACRAHGLQT